MPCARPAAATGAAEYGAGWNAALCPRSPAHRRCTCRPRPGTIGPAIAGRRAFRHTDRHPSQISQWHRSRHLSACFDDADIVADHAAYSGLTKSAPALQAVRIACRRSSHCAPARQGPDSPELLYLAAPHSCAAFGCLDDHVLMRLAAAVIGRHSRFHWMIGVVGDPYSQTFFSSIRRTIFRSNLNGAGRTR